jgi:hypothetical protein
MSPGSKKLNSAIRVLEDHAINLAFEGTKRLVTYEGKSVKDPVTGGFLHEPEFDSQMIMFLLKAYDRKRFGDKIETTFKRLVRQPRGLSDNVLGQMDAHSGISLANFRNTLDLTVGAASARSTCRALFALAASVVAGVDIHKDRYFERSINVNRLQRPLNPRALYPSLGTLQAPPW